MALKQLAAFISLTGFLILSSCAVQFHYRTPPETVLTADNGTRIRGFQDHSADIILGGLFPVHSTIPGSSGGQCTDAVREQGIETVEAMLYAIDAINSDPDLLPNITLSYDIRDTCQSEKIGLDESTDMVLAKGSESFLCNSEKPLPAVMAVIGPLQSDVAIPIASFFRVLQMPQISYASSSSTLNNRVAYSYFFRTKLPTNSLVEAIVDIIVHYKWDLVSVIFSHNRFGESLSSHFRQLAKERKICLDFFQPIYKNFTQPEYHETVKELMKSHAKVVILFTISDHTDSFMRELKNVHDAGTDKKKFLWMTVETSVAIVSKYTEIVAGMWGVVSFSKEDESFESYYSELLIESNIRNPWFQEFYQQKFNCSTGKNCSNVSVTAHPNYQEQSILIQPVIDAVYSVAHAIHNSIMDNCPKPVVWHPNNRSCQGQNNTISGEMLANYLYNVSFTSPTGNAIWFDESGNVEGKFNILNYQVMQACLNCNTTYQLVQIAHWDSTATEHLHFYSNKTPQFGSWGDVLLEFHCQECDPGFIKHLVVSSCCAMCDPCLGPNYTNSTSSTECQICPYTMWGNNPVNGSTGCVDIEESYLKPSDPWGIILMTIAIIGLILTVFVCGVFIWFWNTPIVKSSGREQMILLLTGIVLCFLLTIVFLIKPSLAVCTLQRIGSRFCFSLILSALFVKLVRIARIFMQSNISTRPKCIAPIHQILFTFLLVGIQVIMVGISLSVRPPSVTTTLQKNETNQDDSPVLIVQCTSPHTATAVLQIVYITALTIANNALAMLTVQFPQNFNESKSVAFAMGLMWMILIPSAFGTAKTILMLTIQLSALAILVSLFGPRVFIMIVHPKRNVQMTTAAQGCSTYHLYQNEKPIETKVK